MNPWPWLLAIAGSAAVAIWAETRHKRHLLLIAKPLATVLIVWLALAGRGAQTPLYRGAILAGLLLSLAGDILLLWRNGGFIWGLGSFLLAHVAYMIGFSQHTPLGAGSLALPGLALIVGALAYVLWPRLGTMRAPVLVYALAVAAMVWRAAARWDASVSNLAGAETVGAASAAVGAVLFLLSDFVLAVDRFARPLAARSLLVLAPYWAGQTLIALSLA